MKGEIRIEGEIGGVVTLESVRAQIDPKATEYTIYIDSPGGEVFTGYSIYNLLRNLKQPKTVIITGICASIATLIAGAGDRIKMFNVSQYMIHNPSVGMEGDANDLRKGADTLDQIKQTLISVYERRTKKAGLGKDQLWEMLDAETFMLPEKAKQLGFIDEVIYDLPDEVSNAARELQFVAYIDINKIKMKEKEKKESTLEAISNKITMMMKFLRGAKNMVNDTLEDGTPIIVQTEDDNWEGKPVTFEDGSPLSAGEYSTASGVKFMVDENSTITTVTAPEQENPSQEEAKKTEDEMKENEALKAKVAELEAALAAKNTEAQAKEAEVKTLNENFKKFEATLKSVQGELDKIKSTTAGDNDAPDGDAPNKEFKNKQERGYDPMAELGNAFITSRPYKFN